MEGEPTKTTVKQYVLRELREWMSQMCTGDTPVIIGGDYNETWYPIDRPKGGTHRLDKDYRRWADGLGLAPVDHMFGGRQTHDNTFESRATEGPLLGATNIIDDWLTNKTGEGRLTEREVHERTKTWGGETHMSDHYPLTMRLHSTRVGMKLDGKWADTTTQTTRRAKQIRKGLQPEETQA
eukprot:1173034-Prorocentrum_minimum.AAC.1